MFLENMSGIILLILAYTRNGEAMDCVDLPAIANINVTSYSATPHTDGSTVTFSCLKTPLIYMPNTFGQITCSAGNWTTFPQCTVTTDDTLCNSDGHEFLKVKKCSNCNAGCSHHTLQTNHLVLPEYCGAPGYIFHSGDFDGDGYCDSLCHTVGFQVMVYAYNPITKGYYSPPGTPGNNLYAGAFCSPHNSLYIRDINHDSYADLVCFASTNGNYDVVFVIWGKPGGLVSLATPTQMSVLQSEYKCTGSFLTKMLSCGSKCQYPAYMKFGRYCSYKYGPQQRDQTACASYGMFALIEDDYDLYWLNRARDYHGYGAQPTWVSTRRQPSGQFGLVYSNVSYFPWENGHPSASYDCAILGDHLSTTIVSDDCSNANKQLCTTLPVAPFMCPDFHDLNADVTYDSKSRPEQSTANVTCHSGYNLNDTTTAGVVTCNTDFEWIPLLRCQAPCQLYNISNGIFNYDDVTRLAVNNCNAGYQLRGGSGSAICNADGNWNKPMPIACEQPFTATTEFAVWTGKTLAEFSTFPAVAHLVTYDVQDCIWKCQEEFGCATAHFNDDTMECLLYAIVSDLINTTVLTAPINISLIIFKLQ